MSSTLGENGEISCFVMEYCSQLEIHGIIYIIN